MKQPGNMAAAESRGFVSFVVGGGFFLGGGGGRLYFAFWGLDNIMYSIYTTQPTLTLNS